MNWRHALALLAALGVAVLANAADGRALIEDSLRRHAPPPHVFEEQTLLLSDTVGRPTLRSLRHYAQHDDARTRRLFVVESPAEARGMSLYFARDPSRRHGAEPSSAAFGSDFLVADLEGEQPWQFDYEIAGAQDIQRVPHHLLRALPKPAAAALPGYRERQIFVRKDNLFVTRIDYLDGQGRAVRRQTFRDPQPDEAGIWRPNMILMEDLVSRRRSLLKIERRVHSADYVPESVFEQGGSQDEPGASK